MKKDNHSDFEPTAMHEPEQESFGRFQSIILLMSLETELRATPLRPAPTKRGRKLVSLTTIAFRLARVRPALAFAGLIFFLWSGP